MKYCISCEMYWDNDKEIWICEKCGHVEKEDK
jgi:transcription initiation factor TFIIIB Brf1 subunit/transcription initiation factor TFIIB